MSCVEFELRTRVEMSVMRAHQHCRRCSFKKVMPATVRSQMPQSCAQPRYLKHAPAGNQCGAALLRTHGCVGRCNLLHFCFFNISICPTYELCESARVHSREKLAKTSFITGFSGLENIFNWLFWVKKTRLAGFSGLKTSFSWLFWVKKILLTGFSGLKILEN